VFVLKGTEGVINYRMLRESGIGCDMWPENCYERSGLLQQKFSEKCVKYSDKMAT